MKRKTEPLPPPPALPRALVAGYDRLIELQDKEIARLKRELAVTEKAAQQWEAEATQAAEPAETDSTEWYMEYLEDQLSELRAIVGHATEILYGTEVKGIKNKIATLESLFPEPPPPLEPRPRRQPQPGDGDIVRLGYPRRP